MSETIHAPFTDEQVRVLGQWQEGRGIHPFTCGGEHPRAGAAVDAIVTRAVVLIPTNEGWLCPEGCGYTQTWAHAFMADPDVLVEIDRQAGLIFGDRP